MITATPVLCSQALQECVSALQRVQPYSPQVQRDLLQYADGFICTSVSHSCVVMFVHVNLLLYLCNAE